VTITTICAIVPFGWGAVAVLCALTARAADRYKADNSDTLALSSSWTNGAPGTSEVGVWDATVATPGNCTNALNSSMTWGGVRILNPAAPVKVASTNSSALSLGSSGINLNDPNTSRDLWLALPFSATQPQVWTINTNRTLTVGDINASSALSANVTINGHVRFANSFNVQSGATLTVTDGATLEPTLTVPATTLNIGNSSSGGTVNQTGGTVKINRTDGSSGSPKGALIIAPAGSATATYNLTGGAIIDTTPGNASTVIIGNGSSANGTLNLSGTAVVQVVGLRLANASGATAVINLTNGSIIVTGGSFDLGRTTTATPGPATINVYSGALAALTGMNVPHGNGPGTLNLYSGSVTLGNNLAVPQSGSGGDGTINVNGGQLSITNGSLRLPDGGTGAGMVNLNLGGTLVAPSISRTSGATNASALVLNGGTLKPIAANAAFIASDVTLNVQTNGAVIDTAGFNVGILAPLLHGSGGSPDGGLRKLGAGTLTLAGAGTYNGSTVVSNGALLVNNTTGSGTVLVAFGASLGGTGMLSGPLTMHPGGILAPGSPAGTLTLGSPPSLNGTLVLALAKSGISLSSTKLGLTSGTLAFGGALAVSAAGDALQVGDTFDLLDAPAFSGTFASLSLPTLPLGWTWDTSRLAVDGTITVTGPAGPALHPAFNRLEQQNGTNLLLSGSGGLSNYTYYVLSSINAAIPLTNWTMLATNLFDANGNFSFTWAINPKLTAQFFALSLAPLPLSQSDAEILAMLTNIRDNGFDNASNVNNGMGGLWINWRYGTSPLLVNFNGSGQPDGAAVNPPRHDQLTDLRYLHNLLWYKSRHILDKQFDADIARYTAIIKYEFNNSQNERGWILDEEFLPMWWLSGDAFYQQQALGQASYFANSLYKANIGAYYKTSATHSNGYYRVDWEVELGSALVVAGTLFPNSSWVAKGHQMVQYAYDHAYLTNYHLFLQQMDNVFLPSGSPNTNQSIYLDGDTDGGMVRFGSIGQEALSLLHVYQVTSNQLYLTRAMDLLDPLTVQSNLFGLWDTANGGYFQGLDFPGPTFLSPGTPTLANGKKEAGRQITMLQAFYVANSVTTNRYSSTEAALLTVALQNAYYAPGHGVLYEMLPNWSLMTTGGEPEDWVTTEAVGIVLEALFSRGEPRPW
jgi:autotransporter-associated beta strand protein